MPERVIAGAVDGLVLFAGEEIAVQTVRSIEMEQTGDIPGFCVKIKNLLQCPR